jgi:hypothetical protein
MSSRASDAAMLLFRGQTDWACCNADCALSGWADPSKAAASKRLKFLNGSSILVLLKKLANLGECQFELRCGRAVALCLRGLLGGRVGG